jgi:hypothetical protein
MKNIARALLVLLWVCVELGFGSVARAQTITLSSSGVSHTIARDGYRVNTAINYADCRDEDAIQFSLSLASRGSYALEAWAGSACDTESNRTNSSSTLCWKVYSAVPNTNYPVLSIPVRSILYGRTLASGSSSSTVDTSDAGTSTSSEPGVPDACHDKTTSASAQTITVYFMFVDGGESAQGTITKWVATYKLVAPPPPDHVSAGVGEDLLIVDFSYDDANSDTTINGYQFFCDPPPGAAAAADAGVIPEDGGGALPSCTVSSRLVPGTRVTDELQQFRCGQASSTAASGMATGLVNYVAYNVAVAATDTFENVGELSPLGCQGPQPVTGFFEAYRNAGGEAGGGFCCFSRHRQALPLVSVLGLGGFLCSRRFRRSRRARVRIGCEF